MSKRKGSQEKLLYLLKTRGPQTATSLSELLGMTMMGARQLLLVLQDKQWVDSQQKASGRGRPKLFWQLTEKGHNQFPDRHYDLTLNLLDHVKNTLGDAALDSVISAREQEMLVLYQKQLKPIKTLAAKLKKLSQIRSEEGYMAEVHKQKDGSFLLVENHCPICAAAATCQNFCRSELSIFQQCLNAEVERTEYILDGDRRCAYRVTDNS
ncbi:helix-turn-helix transcriptional regulator [Marinicella sp. W31]|uniref:helix-turn-helix transcriptional regulator n=1 Tax=Marinicella sp. W31 TaxID=3023713 RepID=UPI0037572266